MQWDFKGVESQMVASATWGCLAWGVETIHKSRGCSCNEGWERAWEKVNAQILGEKQVFSELSVNMKWCIKTVENVMYCNVCNVLNAKIRGDFKGRSVLKQGCKEKSGKFQCRGEYSFNTLVRSCRTGNIYQLPELGRGVTVLHWEMFRGREVKFGPQQIGNVMSVELGQTKEAEAYYALAAWKRCSLKLWGKQVFLIYLWIMKILHEVLGNV